MFYLPRTNTLQTATNIESFIPSTAPLCYSTFLLLTVWPTLTFWLPSSALPCLLNRHLVALFIKHSHVLTKYLVEALKLMSYLSADRKIEKTLTGTKPCACEKNAKTNTQLSGKDVKYRKWARQGGSEKRSMAIHVSAKEAWQSALLEILHSTFLFPKDVTSVWISWEARDRRLNLSNTNLNRTGPNPICSWLGDTIWDPSDRAPHRTMSLAISAHPFRPPLPRKPLSWFPEKA